MKGALHFREDLLQLIDLCRWWFLSGCVNCSKDAPSLLELRCVSSAHHQGMVETYNEVDLQLQLIQQRVGHRVR